MLNADLGAKLGQRINIEGIISTLSVISKNRNLAIPHVTLPDIRYIDWRELRGRGFRGVVLDKDNTITLPYALAVWNPLSASIQCCRSVFGDNVVVFSNSAGLHEYDRDGSKAKILEHSIGIKVLRHRMKKPDGTAEAIKHLFRCDSSQLVMVGDRPFTDIVYGNRNHFLTILTEPLNVVTEPFIVRQVRKVEKSLVRHWFGKGLRPVPHALMPDATRCVKKHPTF